MPHVIALKGVIFSIMLIFNIAGLRRSARELEFLRLSKIAFALVIAAGVCQGRLEQTNALLALLAKNSKRAASLFVPS